MGGGSTACSTGPDDGNDRARRLHVIREHVKPLSREQALTLCVPDSQAATVVMVGERVACQDTSAVRTPGSCLLRDA
jgi:hypothetical protein